MIERWALFDGIRKRFGRLNQSQVEGIEAIVDCWELYHEEDDRRWLAYILATAWHETGKRMQPVRETFALSDKAAYDNVTKYCRRYRKQNYAFRHDNGNSYYGRGYVQLTHGENYLKAGELLKAPRAFYDDPDLVMNPAIAAKILIEGMIEGVFTGRKLTSYIDEARCDYVGARRVVNGRDRAWLIAGYAKDFEECL